jgi:hypothetical protein
MRSIADMAGPAVWTTQSRLTHRRHDISEDWLTAFIESYRDRTTGLCSIRRHDLQ